MAQMTKKTTAKRTVAILTAFSIAAAYLVFNLFRLCFLDHDYYRQKTYDQVTTSAKLNAKRGEIYDANMNLLAKSSTSWRIFVSTRDIKAKEKNDGKDYTGIIAEGLGIILGLDKKTLYDKIKGSNQLDVTVKRSVNEDDYKSVLKYVKEHALEGLVFTEASTTRYYPEGTLAAHVLGFTGSDNQGLYGLEYYYDDILAGEDGYYLYAKDANGRVLDTEYSSYFPQKDGYSLVTTIDSYVQGKLESIIERIRVEQTVENRVAGIVMNTETGAILAMATSTPFDPNSPFELDPVSEEKLLNSGYTEGSPEYKSLRTALLEKSWSNKAVSETYEPGSTFKIVTVAAALDSGVAKPNDSFSCKGYKEVGGWRIKCHKTTGHGANFSLEYGLQMSCNPCMMTISERLGASKFYSYVDKFGYFEKTGIDLPSEAGTIFHKEKDLGPTELATASFGQRFKVSIINQLTAISAVANGGRLVTPYLVEKVIDQNGNVISKHKPEIKGQVISEDVARTVSKILIDGVNGNGGAKNAGVSGYDVAAKTGTSQKFDVLDESGNSYLRIGSTVAFAVDEKNGISTIIVVDEPNSTVKYGSVVAAPYVSSLLESILPYLDFSSNENRTDLEVENFVGMNVETAKNKLRKEKIPFEVVGDGETVLSQTPFAGDVVTYPISKVILYTKPRDDQFAILPSLEGLSLTEAIKAAVSAGFNIKLSGNTAMAPSPQDKVIEQSLPPGKSYKKGTTVTLRAITMKFED